MAISRVQYKMGQSTGAPTASIDVTFDSSVTAGSLLICAVSAYVDTAGTRSAVISDDNGNSWTEIDDNNYYGQDIGVLAYALNANSGSTTITVTPTANSWYSVVIIEVSGILTAAALDQSSINTATSASWDSGNITTTQADEYLIGVLAHDNGNRALTEDGAWTLIFEEETGSTDMPISVGERIVSSTLTESYSGTIGASSPYWSAIASFKALPALPATDSFTTGSDQALTTYSSSWTINQGNFIVLAASDDCASDDAGDTSAHWNADSFNADQYAEATISAIGAARYIGVSVRNAASAATFYSWVGDSGDASYLSKYVAGSYTDLGSGNTFSASNVIRLEAEGTTITPYINGSTTGTPGAQTDSAISSGSAGVGGAGGSAYVSRIDDWQGGNLRSGQFGAVVQSGTNTNPNAWSIAVTLGSTPTEGNLLLALHFTGDGNSIAPSGFSEAVALTDSGNADQGAIYYKIAGAAESSTVTCTSGGGSDEHVLTVMEVEGPWNASPLDQTASAGPSSTSSRDTGTTGTTAQADEFAAVLITARHVGDFPETTAWSNGFVEQSDGVSTSFKYTSTATKTLLATGTVTTTATLDGTYTSMGGVATFKKQTGGATYPIPEALHAYRQRRT
jgi:hypothetical protein